MKTMDLKEFAKDGYLQEANRTFFHPIGLALCINIDADDKYNLVVCDSRDEPVGLILNDVSSDEARRKANKVDEQYKKTAGMRIAQLGYDIQPIDL